MNILITGGAGFIGSHTADALLQLGHSVRILDCLDPQIHGQNETFPEYLDKRIECIVGDVRDLDAVTEAMQDIDAVYHFAALTGVGQSMYDLRSYVDTNCTGTATVLEAIIKQKKSLKRLVLSSSRAVYGEGTHTCATHGTVYPEVRRREDLEAGKFDIFCPHCGEPLTAVGTQEERILKPISVYAWTKKQQEEQCRYVAETFGVPVTMLRYFNVYGSRQSLKNPYTGVVSIFYSRLVAGEPIYVYENGKPGRDFVHVQDVVQANVKALEVDSTPGTAFNIGTGDEITILDVANALAKATGTAPNLVDQGEFRVGDIHSCYADLERSKSVLGYSPDISLDAGMKEFAAWAGNQEAVDLYQKAVDELAKHGLFGRAAGR
ncbi:MAG: SDR family NAD(P)-dependent oxidoreductase [Chromatiales bacterium]|nr:SDR family NAD(P)-dependent oxidoreductase [Chromatiales bacterium]